MDQTQDIVTFKVVVIGESFTGKTSLTVRLCTGKFYDKTETTIGVDFFEKYIDVNNEHIKLQLWDSAGQERFRKSMTIHYYRNVDAIVFVYDITSQTSFESLWTWVEEYRHYTKPEQIVKVLIGNKGDLKKLRKVESSVAQEFADRFNMSFWEISTKDDNDKELIDNIFYNIAEKLHEGKPFCLQRPNMSGIITEELSPGHRKKDGTSTKNTRAQKPSEKNTCCSN